MPQANSRPVLSNQFDRSPAQACPGLPGNRNSLPASAKPSGPVIAAEALRVATPLKSKDVHFSTPSTLPDIKIRDKDDLIILSSALDGNADLLVTGDKELLDLGKIGKIEIVSPRGFWKKVRAQL